MRSDIVLTVLALMAHLECDYVRFVVTVHFVPREFMFLSETDIDQYATPSVVIDSNVGFFLWTSFHKSLNHACTLLLAAIIELSRCQMESHDFGQ